MSRQKVDVRREEILAATIDAIERTGMSALRVSDIADALGVSSGLLFYHFETKDALLVEALEFAVVRDAVRLDKALARRGEVTDRLRHVLTSYGPAGAGPGRSSVSSATDHTPGIGDGSNQRKQSAPPTAATTSVGRTPANWPSSPPTIAPNGRIP